MKLLVRNLDRLTTEEELKGLFQEFGSIQSCNLVIDRKSGKSKGFGFIEMPKAGEAKIAIKKLNNKTIGSNKIRVKKAEDNSPMKAIWNGEQIAESNETIVVEGNHYFPVNAVNLKFLVPSDTKTNCPWKGVASYYAISVGGELNTDACWYYPETKEAAKNIQGRVAFWRGVEVTT